MKKIKTSKHHFKNLNLGKSTNLFKFVDAFKDAVKFYSLYIINNKISFKNSKHQEVIFDLKNDLLDCPNFISTTNIKFNTPLSARALKDASTQACSLVKSLTSKRRKLLFIKSKIKDKSKLKNINIQLSKNKINVKNIDFNNINCECSSIISKIEKSNIKHFDTILTLSSIGKSFGKIVIPIKQNKHSVLLSKKSKLLKSVLISKKSVDPRWEYQVKDKKESGVVIGIDTGINSVITTSEGYQSKNIKDKHNHSLNSILTKIKKKKVGSKAFHKALDHRDNYINWSINQLNLKDIKEIRLEKVTNFRNKKRVGKFLNYSGEALIRRKLIDFAEQHGVHVVLQNSAFRSQRCSQCGFVSKKNRKGEDFNCVRCAFQANADYNASCNHVKDLPDSSKIFELLDKRPKEFFWKAEGFFSLEGEELTVPPVNKR